MKKIKLLITLLLVLIFIVGGIFTFKYIFLNKFKIKVGQTLKYSYIDLNILPPKLIINNPIIKKDSFFFTAEKLIINLPIQSIFQEKKIEIFIERPVIKILPTNNPKKRARFILPLIVKKGIIHKGRLIYKKNNIAINSAETDIFFIQEEKSLFVIYKAKSYHFSYPEKRMDLKGKIDIVANIKGKKITIKKLKYYGDEFWFNVNGEIDNTLNPIFNFNTFFNINAQKISSFFSLPFKLQGRIEGKGSLKKSKYLVFNGEISSKKLFFEGSEISPVYGTVKFSNSKGTILNLWFKNKRSPLFLRILPDYIRGDFKNLDLTPILNWLSLGWPVNTPSWGNFEIKNKRLKANFKFINKSFPSLEKRFPLSGEIIVEWNGEKLVRLSSSELLSSFGNFSLEGILAIQDKINFEIKGEIKNLEQVADFVNSLLKLSIDFPDINGMGKVDIKIQGDFTKPKILSTFDLNNVKIYGFNFSRAEGEMIYKNELLSEITIRDDDFKGIATINLYGDKFLLNINLEEGKLNKILSSLNLSLPLNGIVSGKVFLSNMDNKLFCEGTIYSKEIKAYERTINNFQGTFRWSDIEISLPSFRFNFNNGDIVGELYFSPLTRELNVNIKGRGIDISPFSSSLKGKLSFSVKGNSKAEKGMISGNFSLNDFSYFTFPRRRIKGRIIFGEIENNISLELTGIIEPGENSFLTQFIYPLNSKKIKGKTELKIRNLSLIFPWRGAEGEINCKLELSGSLLKPEIKAIADFKGKELPIPKFAHRFEDFSGLILFENNKLQLLSFTAKLGGGKINGFGEISFNNIKNIDRMSLHLDGKNMLLSPFEGARFLCDSKLNLVKDEGVFLLKGDIFVHQMLWRRNFWDRITFSSSPFLKNESENKLLEDLLLDINIRSEKDCWINNSFGTIECKFNLRIFGNVNSPSLLGEITALRGKLFFQDRIFNLIEGKIDFINPLNPSNPEINFKAETFVKDYRVLFSLKGPVNHLKPELSSSPPLPPEEILALLALGEAFKRTYSYDKSTQLSISSLLSFKLTEGITNRAKKIFGIDWFKISPVLIGSIPQTTPRLSLGKKITEDITILYSTNLSTHRKDYLFLEWKFAKDISIIAIRDEEGRIGLDVKFHKRF